MVSVGPVHANRLRGRCAVEQGEREVRGPGAAEPHTGRRVGQQYLERVAAGDRRERVHPEVEADPVRRRLEGEEVRRGGRRGRRARREERGDQQDDGTDNGLDPDVLRQRAHRSREGVRHGRCGQDPVPVVRPEGHHRDEESNLSEQGPPVPRPEEGGDGPHE